MTEMQITLQPIVIHCQTPKTDGQLLRLEELLGAHAQVLVNECEADEKVLVQTAEYLARFPKPAAEAARPLAMFSDLICDRVEVKCGTAN